MSDSSPRADITSRARAADSWDAGLHAESDAGPIDVGLSVEPAALGIILDAPHVGQIRLAFDVDAEGVTRLSAASRRLADGREGLLRAADAESLRALAQLRDRVRALEERAALLTAERDEARDRAAQVTEDRRELEARVLELKAAASARRDELAKSLEVATAALEVEKTARLAAEAETERVRSEHAALQGQASSGEVELSAARDEAAQFRAQAEQLTGELETVRATRTTLEAQLLAAQGEAAQAAAQASATAETVQRLEVRVAEMDAALAAATSRAESLTGQAEGSAAQLAELEVARGRITELEAATTSAERAHTEEVAQLRQSLAEAQLAIEAHEARMEQAVREAKEAGEAGATAAQIERHAQLEADLASLQSQLAESFAAVKDWEAALAAEQAATAEAREAARMLKQQHDQTLAERDEARGIARQLHQKMTSKGGEAALKEQVANLVAERDRLSLQVDALGRQLEGERSARARAVAERDALKERHGTVGPTETDHPVIGHEREPSTERHSVAPPTKKGE